MDFEFVAIIQRPPEVVFAFFRDIDLHPSEPGSLVPVYDKLTPGPAAVGTRYRELVRILPGWHAENISQITRIEPPWALESRFAFGRAMDGTLAYHLQPAGEGTHVRQRQTLRPRGLLKLFSPFIRLAFGKAGAWRLRGIKRLLEAGRDAGPSG